MQIKKIRTKILLILLPLFIASFVTLSCVSYYFSSQYLTEGASETARLVGDKFAFEIASKISLNMKHIEDIAFAPQLKSLDEATIVQRLAQEQQRRPGYTTLFFINLKDPARNYGITAQGKKFDYTTRSYTKHILANKSSYVTEPSISSTTGKLSVMLVTPVTVNNEMVGFVGGTVSLEALSELMKEVKLEQSGFGFIADGSGLIIANARDPESVGKKNVLEGPLKDTFQSVLQQDTQQSVQYADDQGRSHTVILSPVELDGNRWVMVVTAPDEEINAEAHELAKISAGISLAFILVILMIIFYLGNKFVAPLQLLRDECAVLNTGDLRKRALPITSQDELGELTQGFVTMRDTLGKLLKKMQSQAEQLAATSQQLTAGAQQSSEAAEHVAQSITQIAEGTAKQSASAENTFAASQTMSGNVQSISHKTETIKNIASSTTREVDNGRNEIAKVVVQMNKIDEASVDVEKSIHKLEQSGKEIGNIVELISSIAGQTNLLALNAAIEAARAGEHGKGFSVVAEEVRKLAEESNQASERIAQLVLKNQEDMAKAVEATKINNDGVKIGMSAVHSADGTFKNIVDSISTLSTEISEITVAIEQMSQNCSTVIHSIEEIDTVSRQNAEESHSVSAATEQQAATIKDVADASQGLAVLATELQEDVSKFKVS